MNALITIWVFAIILNVIASILWIVLYTRCTHAMKTMDDLTDGEQILLFRTRRKSIVLTVLHTILIVWSVLSVMYYLNHPN